VTTRNYNRFSNSHTLQFTRTHAEVFSVCCVFTNLLVAASTGGCFPSSGFRNCPRPEPPDSHNNNVQWLYRSTHSPANSNRSLTNRLHSTDWLNSLLTNCPAYNTSTRTAQKSRSSGAVYGPLPSNGRCQVVSLSLPSSGSACHSTIQLTLVSPRLYLTFDLFG
jgi:hypothetical protein